MSPTGYRAAPATASVAAIVAVGLAMPSASLAGTVAPDAPRVACHDSAGFRVAVRERTDAVGSDIVVTPAKPNAGGGPCTIARGRGSFELERNEAAYFLALGGRFLALDVGTGPDRALHIFDLASRRTLVDVPYEDGRFAATPDAFVYWRLGAPLKGGACLDQYRLRHGLPRRTAGHELREVRFPFGDGVPRETGRTDCTVTQDDMAS